MTTARDEGKTSWIGFLLLPAISNNQVVAIPVLGRLFTTIDELSETVFLPQIGEVAPTAKS